MISFEQALSNNEEEKEINCVNWYIQEVNVKLTVCVIGLENPLITNIQQQ